MRKQPCRELGAGYVDERDRQAVEKRLVGRLHSLGSEVGLHTTSQGLGQVGALETPCRPTQLGSPVNSSH